MRSVPRGLLGSTFFCLTVAFAFAGAATDARAFDIFGLFGKDPKQQPTQVALPYEVELDAGKRSLTSAMRDVSGLYRLRKDSPPDGAALAQRAAIDLPPTIDALWAEGYYDAAVVIDISGANLQLPVTDGSLRAAASAAEADRGVRLVPVKVTATPGELYRLRSIEVVDANGVVIPEEILPRRQLHLDPGAPARSALLRATQAHIVDYFRNQSRPLAKPIAIRPTVDHATLTMDVVFAVDPGPVAPFGEVSVSGTQKVDPAVVRSFIYIEPGDPYSPKTLADTRRSIASIPAIGSVRVSQAEALDYEGRIPVFVEVSERLPRVVGFSAGVSSIDGPTGRVYWEHRNLFGGAEQLRLEGNLFIAPRNNGTRLDSLKDLEVSDLGGRARITFVKPALWGSRNDFLAELMAERDRTGGDRFGGYTVRDVQGSLAIRHRISQTFSVQGGLKAERGQTSDVISDVDYFIVGTPVSLIYDSTDNPLNPTRGIKLTASATPYPAFLGSTVGFTEGRVQGSTYYAFDEEARFVLAGRAAIGMMGGAPLTEIPANHRFFTGGASSVRGYRYQSLGPTGPFGFVVGGRSLLEVSVEARIKITDTIGIVPFFDAGNAFVDSVPEARGKLYKSAGIGLRYYTPIGPIRADLAFPLDRRPGDKPAALYISIGQAF